VDGKRYWTRQPTVTALADDRARSNARDQDQTRSSRDEGTGPEHGPTSEGMLSFPSSDGPDEREDRLVILGPDVTHANRDEKSRPAGKAARS